ncbi:hypothetical protein AOPFMNJM_2883 [Methylobacterium jeotgali]|uniref:Uncharacterized protein n=1 Tax=Methylobacterium jeotgali TaxID=381630 RepID=A0ABQ4T0K9_9HYPH|nr:hypothetical protein AOPFMNJM_2883 [Methylobacterium jeotgali]
MDRLHVGGGRDAHRLAPAVALQPALAEAALHGHGLKRLRLAEGGFADALGAGRGLGRLLVALAAREIADEQDQADHRDRDQQDQPEPDVDDEGRGHVERHEGEIEERGDAGAGREVADGVEVVQQAQGVEAPGLERAVVARVVDAVGDLVVEGDAEPPQDRGPVGPQHRPEHEGDQEEDAEAGERAVAQGRHHPVEDLDAEEVAREAGDVDEGAEQDEMHEGRPDRAHRVVQRRRGVGRLSGPGRQQRVSPVKAAPLQRECRDRPRRAVAGRAAYHPSRGRYIGATSSRCFGRI